MAVRSGAVVPSTKFLHKFRHEIVQIHFPVDWDAALRRAPCVFPTVIILVILLHAETGFSRFRTASSGVCGSLAVKILCHRLLSSATTGSGTSKRLRMPW